MDEDEPVAPLPGRLSKERLEDILRKASRSLSTDFEYGDLPDERGTDYGHGSCIGCSALLT